MKSCRLSLQCLRPRFKHKFCIYKCDFGKLPNLSEVLSSVKWEKYLDVHLTDSKHPVHNNTNVYRVRYCTQVWFMLKSLETASHCCYSVTQSCPTSYDPKDCSTPGFLSFTISQTLLNPVSSVWATGQKSGLYLMLKFPLSVIPLSISFIDPFSVYVLFQTPCHFVFLQLARAFLGFTYGASGKEPASQCCFQLFSFSF